MAEENIENTSSNVTFIYTDGVPDHLAELRRLFEGVASPDQFTFKVKFCNSVHNLRSTIVSDSRTVILLGSTLSDDDRVNACYTYGADSKHDIPIIVLGPSLDATQYIEYFTLGVSDYLHEPLNVNELFAKVHKHLETRVPSSSTLFEGRYEQLGWLGAGGFGQVYLALDHGKNPPTQVALKCFSLVTEDPNFRSRYLQEVFQLSRLSHPNIVRLIDFGKTVNEYFLVTEYVDGMTLEDVMANYGILNEKEGMLVGYYVGNAINHMANAKIVHRDLSPRNIMLTNDGDVKVIDFGLAKTQMAATLSNGDEFQGTPYYMAPEYILDETVTSKSDLYSLAATIYHMLTGRHPFEGEDAHEVVQAHLESIHIPLREHRSDVSEEFCNIISNALEREPDNRPSLPTFIRYMKTLIDAFE